MFFLTPMPKTQKWQNFWLQANIKTEVATRDRMAQKTWLASLLEIVGMTPTSCKVTWTGVNNDLLQRNGHVLRYIDLWLYCLNNFQLFVLFQALCRTGLSMVIKIKRSFCGFSCRDHGSRWHIHNTNKPSKTLLTSKQFSAGFFYLFVVS